MPSNGWNMEYMDTEGRKLMLAKHIFKSFSDRIAYLICPEQPTFNQQDDAQVIIV